MIQTAKIDGFFKNKRKRIEHTCGLFLKKRIICSPCMSLKNESGNALFYILIAIALLASLSYAVSQSGRSSMKNVGAERAKLMASEIIEYADTMTNAASQLKLRGFTDNQISFENASIAGYTNANCTDDTCKIFSPSGGGMSYTSPNTLAVSNASEEWQISGAHNIEGTRTTDGDLVIYLNNIRDEVCETINELSDVSPAGDFPQDATALTLTAFTGTYATGDAPNDDDASTQSADTACIEMTTPGTYLFYKVLISR